jgi:hypothetical protein
MGAMCRRAATFATGPLFLSTLIVAEPPYQERHQMLPTIVKAVALSRWPRLAVYFFLQNFLQHMKIEIFYFDPDDRFYRYSELVEDLRPDVGFPPDATEVRPIFDTIPNGKIAVFNGATWELRDDRFFHPSAIEVSYNSGLPNEAYRPLALSMYSKHYPHYPAIAQISNPLTMTMAITQRVRAIQGKFENLRFLHSRIIRGEESLTDGPNFANYATSPSLLYEMKFEGEAIVYLMRRVLDNLVQLGFTLTNFSEVRDHRRVRINELGDLIREGAEKEPLAQLTIYGSDQYEADETGFLRILNDLSNSFKHSLPHEQTHALIGTDAPTIVSQQAKQNKFEQRMIFHNHYASQLMIGFGACVERILRNQREFQRINAIHP